MLWKMVVEYQFYRYWNQEYRPKSIPHFLSFKRSAF